jgi:hypothetical protein
MSEPELDPEPALQLAELLNTGLADNDDNADDIAALLAEGVAVGELADDDADDDDEDLALDDPNAGASPDDVMPDPNAGASPDDVMPDPNAGAGPDDMPPPSIGRNDANELRTGPWTDPERRRARGKHVTYRLHATHHRTQPIESQFTGECQSVRVTLPAYPPESPCYIGTYIGRVESDDHLVFSVAEVCDIYEQRHGRRPDVARVELITGARFMGRRFSPISCFLAYATIDAERPCFYVLEGGSASGKPQALYVAADLQATIHQQAGFRFTPLSCTANWYTGALELDEGGHPSLIRMTSAQDQDGGHGYFELSVRYAVEQRPRRVILPFGLQIEAAVRVLAIAEQAGCELGKGRGGGLQPVVGPVAENARNWDIRPQGTATPEARDRYCGCPKPQ